MKKMDINGRVGIPKEIRERNHFQADEMFDVYERGDEIVFRPIKPITKVTEEQLNVIRKLYNEVIKNSILNDKELKMLADVTGASNIICPRCGECLFLTGDNNYKCVNCGK